MPPDTPHRIRVLLVEDEAVVRQGMRALLEQAGDLEVVGEGANSTDALASVEALAPDVVLLDLDLDGENGCDLIGAVTGLRAQTRVIGLTRSRATPLHQLAIRLGASGIVLTYAAGDVLATAIRSVHDGQMWVDRATASQMLQDHRQDGQPPREPQAAGQASVPLTRREREIIALVAQGMSTMELSQRLGIHAKTVRNHLASVYDKVGVHDRLGLALYASRNDLTAYEKTSAAGAAARGPASFKAGDFRVDMDARRVYTRGREVRLTPKEFDLFIHLARNPNRVLTHAALIEAVWGRALQEQPEYLRVFMGQLRKKLEPEPEAPRYLVTEPWVGYRFKPKG